MKDKGKNSPKQVPWEKFYLSICGSFQTGGTSFVAGANRLCEEAAKRRVNAIKIK